MLNLSDSCLIDQRPASIRALAKKAGMKFPLSLRNFIKSAPCTSASCVTLHLKVLDQPTVDLMTMLTSMRTVYNTADISVRVGSRETLSGTAFDALHDLDVADCNASISAEQTTLFANRNNAGVFDVVVYFVRTVTTTSGSNPGSQNGCGKYPANEPGAAVSNFASRWTLAHEVGHVLGLSHISGENGGAGGVACSTPDFTRLMTGCSTSNITGTPTLSATEVETMVTSSFVRNCVPNAPA